MTTEIGNASVLEKLFGAVDSSDPTPQTAFHFWPVL
jgi:hypothetical protein